MPEISDAAYREFVTYQTFGSPQEIRGKIGDLEKDNKLQRDEIRDLKQKLPTEGQVLLSKDDGQLFTTYKELGKPDEIKSRVEEGQKAAKQLQTRDNRDTALGFVKAAGLAEEAVDTLLAIPALENAKFEVRTKKEKDDKGNEKEVKTPYVTLAGEGQKAMSFQDAQDKVSALKGLRSAAPPQKGQGGQEFAELGSEGTDAKNKFDRIREKAKADRQVGQQTSELTDKVRQRLAGAPS